MGVMLGSAELIRQFSPETFARGLDDWAWVLGDQDLTPVAASIFGDVFLQGADGVWFLDTLEATLTRQWPNMATLQEVLNTAEGQDQFLLGGLAMAAQRGGLVPGPVQVLTFAVHPQIGGALTPEKVEVMDYVVASSITGQLLRQVSQMAPGTTISGFTVAEDEG
ncbi:hypothetical protein ACSDQ9_01295 [Aestuariimicrobium soli]|uniref:hypothetical protein n=1 Tax=Aestuariimicrobium soli TaxID=2035834 RepID=UPI003EBB591E